MKVEKPELTYAETMKCKIVKMALQKETLTKMDVADIAKLEGSESSRERKARELIATVAKYYPVISLSGEKGYRIAVNEKDTEDVKHQLMDFESRISEIQRRCKPLIRFLERMEK